MLALLSLAAALAQSVNVNVMPLRDVLPPQVRRNFRKFWMTEPQRRKQLLRRV